VDDIHAGETGTVADEVRAGARQAIDTGKERTRSFVEEQKGALARQLGGFASALRGAAHDLDREGSHSALLAERAAEGMERVAESLRTRDLHGVLDETESFARRSPALFVGGAVTAGFVLARFLKSSRERRDGAGALTPDRTTGFSNPGGSASPAPFTTRERTG
jgi:hypothetical protein